MPEATVAAQRGSQKNKSKNHRYSASDNMVRERPLKSRKLTAITYKPPVCRLTKSYFISLKDSDLLYTASLHRRNERTKFVTSSGRWAVVIDRSQVVALEGEMRRKILNGRPREWSWSLNRRPIRPTE